MIPTDNFVSENQMMLKSAAFMSLAYLAGTKRMIQYFPGMSRRGLFVIAGFTSLNSCIYEANQFEDKSPYAVLKKTGVIACSIFTSLVFHKVYGQPFQVNYPFRLSSNGFSFSLNSALKFGALELVISAIIDHLKKDEENKRRINELEYDLRKANAQADRAQGKVTDLEVRLRDANAQADREQ